MIVYLVPVGKERFELYAEPPEEPSAPPARTAGRLQRWSHTIGVRWHALVDDARRARGTGRVVRWRDALIRRLAETIAEQRTLWGLRGRTSATLLYPSTLKADAARAALNASLLQSRRHHGRWLIVDVLLLVGSAILALVPGPNLIAYYFLFRLVGHLQSWRGARDSLARVVWTCEGSPSLAELASLVDMPRDARASRVAAIAARLNVPRLSAFFDRAAVPFS
jgi:hypothetical protein